jgi:hypothetical protein
MKRCPAAVVHDFHGRQRVLRTYAEAFTTNTVHELAPGRVVWDRQGEGARNEHR